MNTVWYTYANVTIAAAADDDDMSDSDDDEDLDLFGEMTEEEKEAKAKKDAVSPPASVWQLTIFGSAILVNCFDVQPFSLVSVLSVACTLTLYSRRLKIFMSILIQYVHWTPGV